jgi:hypothetical protein
MTRHLRLTSAKRCSILYMMELASSRLPLYHGCFARSKCGNQDDFFAVDVSCNCFEYVLRWKIEGKTL